MKSTNSHIIGMVTAVFSANLFSSKVILVKLAYAEGASTMQVLGIRMATALPFFLVLMILSLRQEGKPRPSGREFAGMAILGLFGYYLASVLDFHGMMYLSAGMERLLLYLYPSFLVVIRSVGEKSLPRRIEVIALVIAYMGAAFVYHEENQEAAANIFLGSILVLGSALSFAFYLYFSQAYVQKFGSRLFASYSTTVSCLAILLHSFLRPGSGGTNLSAYVVFLCVTTGLFCTVISTYLMHQAISKIGSAKVGILGTSGIIAPLILGVVFFAEPVSFFRVVGMSLVLFAVILLGFNKPKTGRHRRSLDLKPGTQLELMEKGRPVILNQAIVKQ